MRAARMAAKLSFRIGIYGAAENQFYKLKFLNLIFSSGFPAHARVGYHVALQCLRPERFELPTF